MRQLMISLDKKILDPTSAVARRMIEYGKEKELYIIIPNKEKKGIQLSGLVRAGSSGGSNKISQFFRLWRLGKKIIQQWNNGTPAVIPRQARHTAGQAMEACIITTQDPFFTGLVGLLLKRRFKIPLEVEVHGDFFGPSGYYRFGSWFHRERWWLGSIILSLADTIRATGERVKENLIKTLRLDPNKIFVRSIVVKDEQIKNYQPAINVHERYPGFEKIFLCLGRFDPVKNIPWLIEVFAGVAKKKPKYLLLIVGEGTEHENIKYQISNIKLENNIKLESWSNDPYSYLKTADCLLFPSLSEGYGLVAMEAAAASTPVIMNDVGVANYELKPSERVKILPINDQEKWIQTILTV